MLEDAGTRGITGDDNARSKIIENLTYSLSLCETVLVELMIELHEQHNFAFDSSDNRAPST